MTDFTPTPTAVEAVARRQANRDGWDWHDDDYTSPDPKWLPTDKEEYRAGAREDITAFVEAEGLEIKEYGDGWYYVRGPRRKR